MPSRSSAAHRASFQGHRLSQAGPQARGCTSCPGTPRLWAPHDEDGGWPLQGQQDHTAAGEEALLENGGPAEEGRVELTPASARRLSWRRAEPAPPRASGEVGSRSVQVRYSGLGCPESVAPARVGRQFSWGRHREAYARLCSTTPSWGQVDGLSSQETEELHWLNLDHCPHQLLPTAATSPRTSTDRKRPTERRGDGRRRLSPNRARVKCSRPRKLLQVATGSVG